MSVVLKQTLDKHQSTNPTVGRTTENTHQRLSAVAPEEQTPWQEARTDVARMPAKVVRIKNKGFKGRKQRMAELAS